jgi:hypothetical protein
MSSLSIQASAAVANLRPQPPTSNAVDTPDTRRRPPNANGPSTAGPTTPVHQVAAAPGGTTATIAPIAQSSVTRLEPTAPPPGSRPAPPNADLANQAAQQAAASNASAENARAVQAGSNRIGTLLNINI